MIENIFSTLSDLYSTQRLSDTLENVVTMSNTSNHQTNNNHSLNNLSTSSLLNGSTSNIGLHLNNNHNNINELSNQRHRTDLSSSLGVTAQLPAHSHSTTHLDTTANDTKSRQQSEFLITQFHSNFRSPYFNISKIL